MAETEPQHWPTERMILEGHADYATPEDLEALDDAVLTDIAQLCDVDQFAPDECIPCLAHVTILERRREVEEAEARARLEAMNPPEGEVIPPLLNMIERVQADDRTAPPIDAALPVFETYTGPPTSGAMPGVPVATRFAYAVHALDALVEEMLEGPPIPPPEVSSDELALLVVAAQRWIRITEAQGVELAEGQERVLEATKALVDRLHRG